MRPVVAIAVAGALVAGGFFAGHTRATRDVSSSLRAQAKELKELRGAVDELSRTMSLLAMIRPAPAAPSEPAPPAAPATARDTAVAAPIQPEHRAQDDAVIQQAEAMLADATGRGRWTMQDEARLREIRNEAPLADWGPVVQKLVAGINSGRLRPAPVETTPEL